MAASSSRGGALLIIGGAFVFLLIAIVLMANGHVGLGLLASVPVVAFSFWVIAVLRNPPNVEEAQEQRRRHLWVERNRPPQVQRNRPNLWEWCPSCGNAKQPARYGGASSRGGMGYRRYSRHEDYLLTTAPVSPTTGQQQYCSCGPTGVMSAGNISQAAPASSLAEEIYKLDTLRQKGVLTAAEFDEAKRRLIGRT